jgi:hypothetical protein
MAGSSFLASRGGPFVSGDGDVAGSSRRRGAQGRGSRGRAGDDSDDDDDDDEVLDLGRLGAGGGGSDEDDSDDDDDEDEEGLLGVIGVSGSPAIASIIDVVGRLVGGSLGLVGGAVKGWGPHDVQHPKRFGSSVVAGGWAASVWWLTAVGGPRVGVPPQVEALGSEGPAWEEVMDTCAVAVAADTTKPLEELGPGDWELMEVRVAGVHEVRTARGAVRMPCCATRLLIPAMAPGNLLATAKPSPAPRLPSLASPGSPRPRFHGADPPALAREIIVVAPTSIPCAAALTAPPPPNTSPSSRAWTSSLAP